MENFNDAQDCFRHQKHFNKKNFKNPEMVKKCRLIK